MQQNNSGGMDGRMILAFALMIGLWIVYSQVIAPAPQKTVPETAQTESLDPDPATTSHESTPSSSHAPSVTDSPINQDTAVITGLVVSAEAEEREIIVDGNLIRAVFSTRGGTLSSLNWSRICLEHLASESRRQRAK